MTRQTGIVPDNCDKLAAAGALQQPPFAHAPCESADVRLIVISAQRLKLQTTVK